MKKITIAAALLLCLALLGGCGGNTAPDPKNSTVLDFGMADIGELATENCFMTIVQTGENAKELFGRSIGLTKNRFVYSYDVSVKAGIDFAAVTIDVDEEQHTVTATLPEVKLLGTTVDNDSFCMYLEENNIFNPISVEDVNASVAEMKTAAEEQAVAKGILDRAMDNAKTLVTNILQSTAAPNGYTVILK